VITFMTIRARLLVVLAAVGIASAGIISWTSFQTARDAIIENSFDKLTAVRETKGNHIEDYMVQLVDQAVTLAESPMIVSAMQDFDEAFTDLERELGLGPSELSRRDDVLRAYYQENLLARLGGADGKGGRLTDYWPTDASSRLLQHLYISGNPMASGSKHFFDVAPEEVSYSDVHARHHPRLRDFLDRFGYYDIFLIDARSGHILYTVFKELDFGTSLTSGPYRDSNLAQAFQAAKDAGERGFVRLVDFAPYDPSYGAQAGFIATPIVDEGRLLGVLALQFPVDRINEIMTSRGEWSRVGLGRTGESYIVGSNLKLRNQSRFLIEDAENYLQAIRDGGMTSSTVRQIEALGSSIGLQSVQTDGTRDALAGNTGRGIFPDYRGVRVLSAYRPLSIPDLDWVIMSEIDEDEALAPARALRNRALVVLLVLVGVIIMTAFWFSAGLTRPIHALAETAGRLADGELEREVPVHGHDEIADLARSFERMRVAIQALVDQQERQIEALSLPLIPLHDDVIAMPLVGELDDARLRKVRTTLVDGIHESGAKAALLDLTGVPRLEPGAAEALLAAAKAVRLLGAHVVLTGMQPAVASSLADLAIHLEGVETARSLGSGVEAALRSLEADRRSPRLLDQEQDA
jgi:anti-anti-sigma regulatory factor/HAMP domain-containing protein